MEELIAKRYAKALSLVCKDMPLMVDTLSTLATSINEEEVQSLLKSPLVSDVQKCDVILSAVSDDDMVLVNFIKILGENKRLDLIPAITDVLKRDLQKELNTYEGVVTSNEPLSDKKVTSLEQTLQKYTGSTIKLKQEQTSSDLFRVLVSDLGIEVDFSKQRVKEDLIDFIKKSL